MLGSNVLTLAQDFSQASKDAFIITRMAARFHLDPRPLNDAFSEDVFSGMLNALDQDKIFFTANDIHILASYKNLIDDEIRSQKTDFLKIISGIYMQRLNTADSAISVICAKPFDFAANEIIASAELDTHAAGSKAWYSRLYKILKGNTLLRILNNDQFDSVPSAMQKKYADSIEPWARGAVEANYHSTIQAVINGPGGIYQFVGEAYCKAIALCYDPHTEYFAATEKENFESALGDKTMAFGFQFKKMDDGSIQIDNVLPGSPAYQSGQINKGDRILSIQWDAQDAINVEKADWNFLSKALSLSNHGKATFQIRKPDGSVKAVMLWKEKLDEENDEDRVKSFILEGEKKIGFISLPAFYQDWEDRKVGINGCANDIAKEILKLKKEKIQGLILDLRYNGGGSVMEAVELAGIFIDAGSVAQVRGRDSLNFTLKDVNRGTMYDGPLVLMVNGYSASASELLAGTLQDYHRAVIAGTPTYGKATAQIVLPLDTNVSEKEDYTSTQSDRFVKMTISQLFRINGSTAQATGVLPDIFIPDLSETVLSREKDKAFFIKPSQISSSKYSRVLPPIDLLPLQRIAQSRMDSSSFFVGLNKYIALSKKKDTASFYSLNLYDALSIRKKMNVKEWGFNNEEKINTDFKILNNAYEKQQMLINESLKELNNQWADFLLQDHQLGIAFNIITAMIQ